MPVRTRIVLHLGAHKTGTSVLQKFMRDRPWELARMGASAIPRSATNTLIGWGQVPQKHPEKLREAVLAASRQGRIGVRQPLPRTVRQAGRRVAQGIWPVRTVIVSHENSLGPPIVADVPGLYPRAQDCAQGLQASVGDLDVRVIYYIRAQEEYLESYYLQTVHQGSTRTFTQWLADVDVDAVSWVPVVDALTEAFGEERVTVRDFAEIRRGQNEFIADFLRICDPSLNPTVSYPARRNFSVSQQGLDLALAINPLLETPDQRRATRKFLQDKFSNATGPRPQLFTDAQKHQLRARYSAENTAILERLGATNG